MTLAGIHTRRGEGGSNSPPAKGEYPKGEGVAFPCRGADPARSNHPVPSGHPSLAGGELEGVVPLLSVVWTLAYMDAQTG